MTSHEVRLWVRLRELRAQGFRFRRQIPLDRWIVDFVCFRHRLIVEVDGDQHGFESVSARDAVRDAHFSAAGFRTLRFSNGDVRENIEGVVETIMRHREFAP